MTIRGGTVGNYAFDGCTNLESVVLSEGVTSIGSYAFQGCQSLRSLSIPDSVTSYGSGMILGCTGLKYLRVGGGLAELEYGSSSGWSTARSVYNPFCIIF